jgi:hypothetical protein
MVFQAMDVAPDDALWKTKELQKSRQYAAPSVNITSP